MPFTDLKYFDIRFIFILHSVIGNLIQNSYHKTENTSIFINTSD